MLLLCLCLAAGCAPADRRAYPARPITYLVPWNAGGGTDTVSRTLAAVLGEELGRSVSVINRTGEGDVVGHLALYRAKPDSYTIFYS